MKILLATAMILGLTFVTSYSQCEFHEDLSFETALIFPLPFGVIPEEEGGLGINRQAVVGSPFDFKWTMIWPDSFSNATTGGIAFADTNQFFLDQTIWVLNDDTVAMPAGLNFEITPESGFFLPNSESPVACIRLSGIPEEDVVPGDYKMTFSTRACLNIPGVFEGCQDAFIPSLLSGFPGEYSLTIKPTGTTSVKETLNNQVNLNISPNPFSTETIIAFNSEGLSNDYSFEVYNLNGQLVQSRTLRLKSSQQRITFDASNLNAGLYVFQIKGNEGVITDKLMVQR